MKRLKSEESSGVKRPPGRCRKDWSEYMHESGQVWVKVRGGSKSPLQGSWVLVGRTGKQGGEFVKLVHEVDVETNHGQNLVERNAMAEIVEDWAPFHGEMDPAVDDVVKAAAGFRKVDDPVLLQYLRLRFLKRDIFTRIGETIVVSINPYQELRGSKQSIGDGFFDDFENNENHLSALARKMFEDMVSGPRRPSQSILVNGESGAGKTEAAKFIMRCLAKRSQGARVSSMSESKKQVDDYFGKMGLLGSSSSLAGSAASRLLNQRGRGRGRGRGKGRGSTCSEQLSVETPPAPVLINSQVEKSMIAVNPIFESFGNAVTAHNNNSSRFGKYLELKYDKNGVMFGATTMHFLLEKTRVTSHAKGQRSFHIFYELMDALKRKKEDPEFENLEFSDHYNYLDPALDRKDLDDDISETVNAFEEIGVNATDRRNLWEVLLLTLEVGNLAFSPGQDKDSCSLDATNDPLSCKAVERITRYLHIGPKELDSVLCFRTVSAGKRSSVFKSPLSVAQAYASRDGLAKALFTALFDFVVDTVNRRITNSDDNKTPTTATIAILDVFGFESVRKNSFEQLCINYSNERLQKTFDDHVLKAELEKFQDEGIVFDMKGYYRTNLDVINVFESKENGVLTILDESSQLNLSDEAFVSSVLSKHQRSRLLLPATSKSSQSFVIAHHFHKIEYHVHDWVSNNMDSLQPDVANLLFDSANHFVAKLFTNSTSSDSARLTSNTLSSDVNKDKLSPSAGGRTFNARLASQQSSKFRANRTMASAKSISNLFRKQLGWLDEKLTSTNQRFVRCVKPNPFKSPLTWDGELVQKQLGFLSILEAVRFHVEMALEKDIDNEALMDRFGKTLLLSRQFETWQQQRPDNTKKFVSILMTKTIGFIEGVDYRIGNTKTFFKKSAFDTLETMCQIRLNRNSRILTRSFRTFNSNMEIRKLRRVVKIQAYYRGLRVRRDFKRRRKASIRISNSFRTLKHSKSFRAQKNNVIRLQAWARMHLARRRFQKLVQSVLAIQCLFRKGAAEAQLVRRRSNRASTKIQSMFRMHSQRSQRTLFRNNVCKVQAVVRGYFIRQRYLDLMEARKAFTPHFVQGNELVQLHTVVVAKKLRATQKALVLTSGPNRPRVLLIDMKKHQIYKTLEWDREKTIVFVPSPKEIWMVCFDGEVHKFTDLSESAVKWVRTMRRARSNVELLCLPSPSTTRAPKQLAKGYLWMRFVDPVNQKKKSSGWKRYWFELSIDCDLTWKESQDESVVFGGFNLTGETKVKRIEAKTKKKLNQTMHQLHIEASILNHGGMIVRSEIMSEIDEWERRLLQAIGMESQRSSESNEALLEDLSKTLERLKETGNRYFKIAEFVEAIKEYSIAIDLAGARLVDNPIVLACLNNRALCFMKQGDFENCVDDASLVIQHQPENAKAHLRKGLALEQLGDLNKALSSIEQALQINSTMNEAIQAKDRLTRQTKRKSNLTLFCNNHSLLHEDGNGKRKSSSKSPSKRATTSTTTMSTPPTRTKRVETNGGHFDEESDDVVIARYDYEGADKEDLTFRIGDRIKILRKFDDGWCQGKLENDNTGLFPLAYCTQTKD